MKSLFISVNPVGSKFAKALQGALRDKVDNKVFRVDHRRGKELANRGRNVFFVTPQTKDKIEQFKCFHGAGVSTPKFAVTADGARELGCRTLFARTIVNGTSGRGIVEFEASDAEYPNAPLYTEYIPKKSEYRVHVFNGEVIDVQQKRKARGFEGVRNTRVRNVSNGYVYCRDDVSPPECVIEHAKLAVSAVGYRYGAVDVVFNESRNAAFVLEVNSRPGLMGTTLEKYSEALIKQFNLRKK